MGQKPFPLNVVPAPGGWQMVIALENGESNVLLKPGLSTATVSPYLFPTEQAAWEFVKELFWFCIQQAHMQCLATDKISNCQQCGRIFRAKIFNYCYKCMQGNEFMLQQIWQGFYHMTGSEESTRLKIALLLKIPEDDFSKIPAGFKNIVQRQLALHIEVESRKNSPAHRLDNIIKSYPTGLHLRRKQ